jgi:hypothetical protein
MIAILGDGMRRDARESWPFPDDLPDFVALSGRKKRDPKCRNWSQRTQHKRNYPPSPRKTQ